MLRSLVAYLTQHQIFRWSNIHPFANVTSLQIKDKERWIMTFKLKQFMLLVVVNGWLEPSPEYACNTRQGGKQWVNQCHSSEKEMLGLRTITQQFLRFLTGSKEKEHSP